MYFYISYTYIKYLESKYTCRIKWNIKYYTSSFLLRSSPSTPVAIVPLHNHAHEPFSHLPESYTEHNGDWNVILPVALAVVTVIVVLVVFACILYKRWEENSYNVFLNVLWGMITPNMKSEAEKIMGWLVKLEILTWPKLRKIESILPPLNAAVLKLNGLLKNSCG